jgi:hypothetical protein
MLLQDLEVKGDEAIQIVRDIDPSEADRLERYGAFNFGWSPNKYDNTLQSFYRELTGEDGEMYEKKITIDADDYGKLKNQFNPDDEVEITEEDDEATPDKGVAKRGNKLDTALKALKAVKKSMKTHLAMYKDAEGDVAKLAALKMLKKETAQKKELESLVKRLEGDVVK